MFIWAPPMSAATGVSQRCSFSRDEVVPPPNAGPWKEAGLRGLGPAGEESGAGPPRRAQILTESVLLGRRSITALPALGPSCFILSGE